MLNRKPSSMLSLHRVLFLLLLLWQTSLSAEEIPAFYTYLTESQQGEPPGRLVGYTPAELDPRSPQNQVALKTSSIRADLVALRPAFDGLILYGYNEACTPRILAVAQELGYRAVLLGIWEPKSMGEVDGVAALVQQFQKTLALGVLVGNEGIIFGRYEVEDITIAAQRLRSTLGPAVPLSTSEPLVGYNIDFILNFGDFLAPNIHPVFDRPEANAEEAVQWVQTEARRLCDSSRKPVLIKETGFPHAGKPIYTPETQRRFWKAYTAPGLLETREQGWVSYAAGFEAFDLPWKAEASGLEIEKSWGLLSVKRAPYPAFEVWQNASRLFQHKP